MEFPLKIDFKVWAIVPQIFVSDSNGSPLLYIKQKLFKLKEEVNIFADRTQQNLLYKIKADRVMEFSAKYNISDAAGLPICAIKRNGMKSLWKADYDIYDGDIQIYKVKEENPWVVVMDNLLKQVPILSMFSGLFFHPIYLITRGGEQGELVVKVSKKPSFFESRFEIEKIDQNLQDIDASKIVISSMMMLLLERMRG